MEDSSLKKNQIKLNKHYLCDSRMKIQSKF